jgi:hypothetical protein
MTDQELADAIRERWPIMDQTVAEENSTLIGDLIRSLMTENPPWRPEPGDRVLMDSRRYTVIGPHPDDPQLWYLQNENVATVWFHIDNITPVEE